MYFEEAEVKEYKSTNKKKGTERTTFQINLNKKSKFREPKKIALIDISEIKKIVNDSNIKGFNELRAKYNDASKDLTEVKKELKQTKVSVESLASEVEKLKEEKLQLQEDLLTEKKKNEELTRKTNSKIEEANKNVIEARDKIIDFQKEHKIELAEVNEKLSKEKDTSKTLLLGLYSYEERGLKDSLLNRTPSLVKQILKENPKPIEAKKK